MDCDGSTAVELAVSRSRLLILLGIGVAVGVLVLGGVALMSGRNDAWRQADQSANNLLLALDRDITRNINVLDLSLIGVMEALAEPGIDQVSPSIRQHTLFDRSATADDLGSILVLDPDGKVVADSASIGPHSLNLVDRDHFEVHRRSSVAGLFVSRVFRSRLAEDDLRFAISRRWKMPSTSSPVLSRRPCAWSISNTCSKSWTSASKGRSP